MKSKMDNNSLISPRFIIGTESTALSPQDIERLQNKHVVGVILFARNFKDSDQLKQLTAHIKSIRNDLLTCTDQEGGRVQRFRTDGFSPLCTLYDLANAQDDSQIHQHVKTLASELKIHGIDFSFTPVVDLYNRQSRVINNRAFAEKASDVIRFASRYIDCMHHYKLPSILKHFPGHGSLIADTHLEKAVDERFLQEIEQTDLQPFISLIQQQKADSVMVAHLLYPIVDDAIASMSHFWLTDYLRSKLHFDGMIFSDDFGMFAATNQRASQLASCQSFFAAGGDIALLCNDFDAINQTLNYYSNQLYREATGFHHRWQRFKKIMR